MGVYSRVEGLGPDGGFPKLGVPIWGSLYYGLESFGVCIGVPLLREIGFMDPVWQFGSPRLGV